MLPVVIPKMQINHSEFILWIHFGDQALFKGILSWCKLFWKKKSLCTFSGLKLIHDAFVSVFVRVCAGFGGVGGWGVRQ